MLDHSLARLGQLAVATLLGRHVNDDATGLHVAHHFGCDQLGCRLARNERGGDDDVALFGLLRIHLTLRRLEAFAHHFGITAAARALFFVIDLDKLTAQRHYLIGDFGACVVSANDGAQAGCRANGSQTRYASTCNENLGRRHFARSCNLAVKKATKSTRCFDHSAVATHTRHRGQCVHFLSSAERARQSVNGQRGDFFGRQLLHQIGVLSRPQETNEGLAFVHEGNFLGCRCTDLEDDVATTPKRCCAGRNACTSFCVGLVREVGQISCALLDHHRKAKLSQLGDHIGHGGNSLFARENLFGNTNALGARGNFAV